MTYQGSVSILTGCETQDNLLYTYSQKEITSIEIKRFYACYTSVFVVNIIFSLAALFRK